MVMYVYLCRFCLNINIWWDICLFCVGQWYDGLLCSGECCPGIMYFVRMVCVILFCYQLLGNLLTMVVCMCFMFV